MSLETFLTHFYKEYNEINDSLNGLVKLDDKSVTQELKLKLSSDYELISNRTEILHKYFTDNTPFIPQYEIRKAQEHLNKLKRLSQDKRDEIFPKKKFGFKSKQKITTLENTIENTNSETEKKKDTVTTEFNLVLTENTCTIKDIDGQNIIKLPSDINSKDIAIINVNNSIVQLLGNPSVVHANNIENSTILCGPVPGSGLFYKMKNVKLVIGCHQLRIHDSSDCQFYIHLGSRAIIENCSNVKFAPYAWTYPTIQDDFSKSGLDPNQSNWTNIDDFNFLKLNQKSPNWSYLDESERIKWTTNDANELNTQ